MAVQAIHLPTLPDGAETRCGLPITRTVHVAMVPSYASCAGCLRTLRHGHEGAVREHAFDVEGDQEEHGYGHGV